MESDEEFIDNYEDELEDDKLEELEDEKELREELEEDQIEDYGIPEAERNFDRMKFLTEIRDNNTTIRTANLSMPELGMPLFPVRFWINLALFAEAKNYKLLAAFLQEKAQVTTHSSLSKDGFLVNASYTRRKESTRTRNKPQEVKDGK